MAHVLQILTREGKLIAEVEVTTGYQVREVNIGKTRAPVADKSVSSGDSGRAKERPT